MGSGVTFALDVDHMSIPMHVFDTVDNFRDVMARTVSEALREGIHGWEVTDCAVTMTDSAYQSPPRKWPGTTLSDFRSLTPLVLMEALRHAGTTVCEPVLDIHLEFPGRHARIDPGRAPRNRQRRRVHLESPVACAPSMARSTAARLHDLQSRLPDLTAAKACSSSAFGGYRPVAGAPPSRPRTDHNPLDRADYLRRLKGRGTVAH